MTKKNIIDFDKLGICSSLLCMIHCVAVPLVLVLGMDTVLWMIDQEWVEITFIALSLALGLTAFSRGFLVHKQHYIPVLFVAGFLLLVNGESVSQSWLAILLSIAGASVIVYAHLQNLKWKHHASVG